MLKTRIVTAVFLLSAVLSALFYLPPIGWVVFATIMAAIAAWEWGALMALTSPQRVLMGAVVAVLSFVLALVEPSALGLDSGFTDAAWSMGRWFYIPAAVFWGLIVPFWMKRRWLLSKSIFGLAAGAVVILPTWLALIQLKQTGPLSLIAVMATVWVADTAAYIFGRTFGKSKLAPSISPGKTWEGAIGGGLAVIMYGFMLAPRLSAELGNNTFLLLIVLVLLTVISIIGDLFESLLKRQAGLKDSSNILPGHGGVLDRIDSLTSTLPLVALVWLATLH